MRKNIVLFVVLCMCVSFFFTVNYLINNKRKQEEYNLMLEEQQKEFFSGNEYVKTVNCMQIFDESNAEKYIIEFEIKAEQDGKIIMYQNDENGHAKYTFSTDFYVTKDFQKMKIEAVPQIKDMTASSSYLAFYGGYGTGVIPYVRYIRIIPSV